VASQTRFQSARWFASNQASSSADKAFTSAPYWRPRAAGCAVLGGGLAVDFKLAAAPAFSRPSNAVAASWSAEWSGAHIPANCTLCKRWWLNDTRRQRHNSCLGKVLRTHIVRRVVSSSIRDGVVCVQITAHTETGEHNKALSPRSSSSSKLPSPDDCSLRVRFKPLVALADADLNFNLGGVPASFFDFWDIADVPLQDMQDIKGHHDACALKGYHWRMCPSVY
jgi:hypothetical protein